MGYKLIVFAALLGVAAAYPSKKPALATRHTMKGGVGNRLGIYEGKNTTIQKHPYMVGIIMDTDLYCAGAIVSESWIITSADCVYDYDLRYMTVVAGSRDGSTGEVYAVKTVMTHPKFKYGDYAYDYGLINIKDSFTWGSKVSNISLPSKRLPTHTQLDVIGYGDTTLSEGDAKLREGSMKLQSNATCNKYYGSFFSWQDSEMCAFNKGKTTICTDDFGDPFVHKGVLYGVTIGCYTKGFCTSDAYPTVLADIFFVKDWIKQQTGAHIAQS